MEAQLAIVTKAAAQAESLSRIEIAALKTQLVHAHEERDAAAAQASAQLQLAMLARDEAAAAALRAEQAADVVAAEKRAVEREARLADSRLKTELAQVKLLLQRTERALADKAASTDPAVSPAFRDDMLAACNAFEAEVLATQQQ